MYAKLRCMNFLTSLWIWTYPDSVIHKFIICNKLYAKQIHCGGLWTHFTKVTHFFWVTCSSNHQLVWRAHATLWSPILHLSTHGINPKWPELPNMPIPKLSLSSNHHNRLLIHSNFRLLNLQFSKYTWARKPVKQPNPKPPLKQLRFTLEHVYKQSQTTY